MSEKQKESILIQSLDLIMSDRFGRYSKYIIQGRALPDVRDGLKPVQRRILFSMKELGLLPKKPFKKSARVVGDVIGKYHPHGDSSIYEAMVRMSQDWKSNLPLVEMHGNNGSIDDDPAAAMRYTEARLSSAASEMLIGIKRNSVPFSPNFDDSEKEPTVLPSLIPNLLVNGAKGIAAGYATEMPPHNLGEVIDAIIAKIKSPNARLETLLSHIKGPDFPTGGIVQGADGIYEAFESGRGKIVIRSKYEIEESKTNPYITITEIPYGVIKSKLVRQIEEIKVNKKISGIKEVRDDSGRDGISIFVQLSFGANVNNIIKYLLKKTELQVYYNYNNIAIKDQRPEKMGIINIIDAYLNHQQIVQKNIIKYNLAKDEKRLEILQGLIKVAKQSDAVIDAIRDAKGSRQGVIESLMFKFDFTEIQANAIADLRLYRLSATDQETYISESRDLEERITYSKTILESNSEYDKFLIDKLKEIKKNFATARKTVIEKDVEKIEINLEKLIKHEEVWISVSKQGYIKRFSNRTYESNNITDFGLKGEDSIIYIQKINTSNKLLLFTDDGKYVFLPTHKVAEVKWKDIGKHINDHAPIGPLSNIVDVVAVSDFNVNANIVFGTAKGKGKRTRISEFEVSRYSKPLVAMKLAPGDKVIGAKISNNHSNIIMISSSGKVVKYTESQITQYSTKSNGVKAMVLNKDEEVTCLVIAKNTDVIGILSKRGGAKRIKVSSIFPMSKTTQGKQLYRIIKGNPHITIEGKVVTPKDSAIFIDSKGQIKEIQFSSVDITGTDEGFSSVGSSQTINARILKSIIVSKDEEYFNVPDNKAEEEIFEEAEKTIDNIEQISIDDILKDL